MSCRRHVHACGPRSLALVLLSATNRLSTSGVKVSSPARASRFDVGSGYSRLQENIDQARNLFEFKIDPYGRQPKNPQGPLLDFEIEYGKMMPTPDAVLDSLYWGLPTGSCHLGPDEPVLGPATKWFTFGTDGGSLQRQLPAMTINAEITSASFVSPETVLNTDMLPSFDTWMEETNQRGAFIPGSREGLQIKRPFNQSSMFWQYTVGLPLEQIYTLLRYSAANSTWQRVERHCGQKPTMYKAVVAIAAMTAESVTTPAPHNLCTKAKRYVFPWLVRTHHGDMVAYAKKHVGDTIFTDFKDDVLKVSGAGPVAFPNGVIDYLHIPEIAEMSGLIRPRNGLNMDRIPEWNFSSEVHYKNFYARARNDTHFPLRDETDLFETLPLDRRGVCELAATIARNHEVAFSVIRLGCGVYFPDGSLRQLQAATPSEWLDGVLQGKDLWTDPENEFVQASSSRLVFKSMGRWRMHAGYVYLECHNNEYDCLGPPASRFTEEKTSLKLAAVARKLQEIMLKM